MFANAEALLNSRATDALDIFLYIQSVTALNSKLFALIRGRKTISEIGKNQIKFTAMLKKILILSASVGAGHIRAAEAIEKEFKRQNPAAEVKNIDVLNYTNLLFRRLYGKAYLDMVNKMPEVLGWLYDSLDKPWQNERRRLALDRLNTRLLIKFLKQYQPDVAVCTHFLPAEIISWLKAKD